MALELYIKDMVCVRCIMAVQAVLNNLSIDYESIELGKITFKEPISPPDLLSIKNGLAYYQLFTIVDRKEILVEKIKSAIVDIFNSDEFRIPERFTDYLSKKLFYDYTHLSNIFSELESSTIEHFYIITRIERIKTLLLNDIMTVTQISNLLGFSSVSHLCIQFKKLTGKTPSDFKQSIQMEKFILRAC